MNLKINPNLYFSSKKLTLNSSNTIEEAKKMGAKKLGISKYNNFEADSLELLNYLNQGLFLARYNTKTRVRLPNYIDLEPLGNAQMSTKFYGGILSVNENIYSEAKMQDEIIRIGRELIEDEVLVFKCGKYSINEELIYDEAQDFLQTLEIKFDRNLDNLSYEEKIELYNSLRALYEQTSILNRFPKDLIVKMLEASCWGEFKKDEIELFKAELFEVEQNKNFSTLFEFLKEFGEADFKFDFDIFKYRTIFHELGHLQDVDFFYEPSVDEFNSWEKYPKELKLWLNDKCAMKAAFSVSPYACFGKGEFIAECYSWLLEGRELPKEAKKLYAKLKGPKVVLE